MAELRYLYHVARGTERTSEMFSIARVPAVIRTQHFPSTTLVGYHCILLLAELNCECLGNRNDQWGPQALCVPAEWTKPKMLLIPA